MKKNFKKSRNPNSRNGNGNNNGNNKGNVIKKREKYAELARNARASGERVDAEYYSQYVEHFTRVLNDIVANEPGKLQEKPSEKTPQKPEAQGNKAEVIEIKSSRAKSPQEQDVA